MCAFWREEKKLGANVTSLSVCIKTAWILRRKERAKPAQLCILMGLYFPKKKLIFLPCPLFSTKACLSHNGRKILFSTTPARKPFFSFVCLYVCACVSILCFLISFRILLERTKKKKLISCHARVRLLVLIFPRFQSTYPDNDNVLCGCSLFVSFARLMSLLCPLHFWFCYPRAIPQRKKQDKKEQKKIMSLTRILKNKIKKENTMPFFYGEFEDVIIKLANQAIWNWVKGIPFCGHLKCPFPNNRVGTNE